jgi:hypothetical protein
VVAVLPPPHAAAKSSRASRREYLLINETSSVFRRMKMGWLP